jgi:hypothetical protein
MSSVLFGDPQEVFHFNKRAVYFGQKKWSRGVTTVIKKVFAPSYVYRRLQRSKDIVKTGLPFRKARRRGKLVDEVLGKWVRGGKTRCRILEARALIELFESRRWLPLASQLVVGWREGRIATMIDVVLHDEVTDQILIVEIKSGCEYRHVSTGSCMKCLQSSDVPDSPLHQHQLQTLLGKELFNRTYKECTKSVRGVLIYVGKDGSLEIVEESQFRVLYTDHVAQAIIRTA